MGFSFGGVVIEHRGPLHVPRTRAEQYDDPNWNGNEDPDSSQAVLHALYSSEVERSGETVHIHEASSSQAEGRYVAFHKRSVVILDRWGALDFEFETPGELNEMDRSAAELSGRDEIARVMAFTLDSVSDSYAFSVFEGGARTRRWSFIPTSTKPIEIDEGPPLPSEPRDEVHGEVRIDEASKTLLDGLSIIQLVGFHEGPVFKVG